MYVPYTLIRHTGRASTNANNFRSYKIRRPILSVTRICYTCYISSRIKRLLFRSVEKWLLRCDVRWISDLRAFRGKERWEIDSLDSFYSACNFIYIFSHVQIV